jgi:hypothetical protein
MRTTSPASAPGFAREAQAALLAILGVKLLFLLLDPLPRFFLWDSVTFLNGGLFGDLPRDRSILYSLIIGATAVRAHSLEALVIAQTLAGVGSAMLLFFIVRRQLDVRFPIALAAAALFAADPSQLWYERLVMAEAFGSLAWLSFAALALQYCRSGRAALLPLVALAGILAVSFRLNPTLTVVTVGGFLPLWRAAYRQRLGDRRALFAHLALALASTAVLHVGYQQMIGRVLGTPPGYIGVAGLFQMGFVAPLIEPRHFEGTGCPPDILTRFPRPLADPREREGQLWGSDGLWAAMQKYCKDPETDAATVAHRASHDHPLRALGMGFATAAQYFDPGESDWRMESDIGHKGSTPWELIEPVREFFFLSPERIAYTDSTVIEYFKHAKIWFTVCFFALPLLAWLALVGTDYRDEDAPARALVTIALWLFGSQLVFSHVICFRYLHPFMPMVIALLALLLERRRRGAPLLRIGA